MGDGYPSAVERDNSELVRRIRALLAEPEPCRSCVGYGATEGCRECGKYREREATGELMRALAENLQWFYVCPAIRDNEYGWAVFRDDDDEEETGLEIAFDQNLDDALRAALRAVTP